ncbi:hypothetical protein CVQ10_003209 [Escherichia coli]|nr:hypothetical protein [Escherichia coli]
MNTNIYKTPYGVFFGVFFGCVLGFKWVYLSSLPHFNYQSMIICLVLVFCWAWYGLFLGFVWRITKDIAGLLFLLRRLTRRGRNAACGQCPASGRARDGRFYRSRLASVTVYASPSPFSDERPSSRFRGIALPSKRRRLRYSTVGLTRYRAR